MYQIRPMTRHHKSGTLRLASLLALIASLITATQVGLILFQGEPFCPSDGCKLVEQLTKAPPLFFNLVGMLFFQIAYWGLRSSGGESRRVPGFVPPLLLAGLATEGVLIGFQFLVVRTFCAYCLAILGVIVLLNLLLGLRHAAKGALIFAAALLAFASLEHNQASTAESALTGGVFASRQGTMAQPAHHLFYSSTCAHCEQVIAMLRADSRPTVQFHPIDTVTAIDLPQVNLRPAYSPQANKALLTALGIDEIPVLVTPTADGMTVVRGAQAIAVQLGLTQSATVTAGQPGASTAPNATQPIPGLESKDGCQVSADCADPASSPAGQSPSPK